MKFVFFLILAFQSTVGVYDLKAQGCGVERWSVKTLSDDDTSKIKFNEIKVSTVHEQVNLEAPFGRLYEREKSETIVYSIDCFIIGYKKEDDKDIHIIVEDIDTDETMVVEIISPECLEVRGTSRYNQVKELYEWFCNNIEVPRTNFHFLKDHIRVNITGVGFWDFLHGQKGMANNGREIHPVLSMKILKP